MTCDQIRDRLSALLDDALSAEEADAVREHVFRCEECREALDALEATVALVRGIPDPDAPDGFVAEVMDRLPRPAGRRSPLLWLAPLAVAACVLLIASLAFGPRDEPRPRRVADGPAAEREGLAAAPPEEPAKPAAKHGRRGGGKRGELARRDAGRKKGGSEVTTLEAEASSADAGPGTGGSFSGPAGEVPPDRPRVPAEAGEADGEARSGPGIPGGPVPPAAADPPGDGMDDRAAHPRTYAVEGAQPDAAAGWILAELHCLRDRAAGARPLRSLRVANARRLELDDREEPRSLVVSITARERDYLLDVMRGKPGVRIFRLNGKTAPDRGRFEQEEADEEKRAEDAPGREAAEERRAAVRFRFSR